MTETDSLAADGALTIPVALGPRSYDILIGRSLLARAGTEIGARLPGRRAAIVTDENVAALHLEALAAGLSHAGIEAGAVIAVPPGEGSKSFPVLEQVVARLLESRLERGDAVIALGGGVVGDLAGFAAGITRRGMNLVQVPTTLLAQVDSSVGGKTAINTAHGKNLVGVFHQPQLVLADTEVLATLPPREFRAGYAEIVKYGLIDDAEFFASLEVSREALFAGEPDLAAAIAVSCRAKARIVAADERESGQRALLNLGHTFAHALEGATGYSRALIHGEAVAIGLVLAMRFSHRLGLAPAGDGDRVAAHLQAAGLPTRLADAPGGAPEVEPLMSHIAQDKKVSGGRLTFVLARGIGAAFIAPDVPAAEVRAFLAEERAR